MRPCNALIKFLALAVIKVCIISNNVISALFIAMLIGGVAILITNY